MAVDHHNHFALLVVLQNFMGAVDFRVLVDQAVTGVVPDHFDRHVQLIFAPNTVTQRGHFRAALDRVRPHKHGDAGLNRVIQRWHTFKRDFIRAFTRPAITAVNTNVASQNREHRNSAGGNFAVRVTLWSPSLADISRFC